MTMPFHLLSWLAIVLLTLTNCSDGEDNTLVPYSNGEYYSISAALANPLDVRALWQIDNTYLDSLPEAIGTLQNLEWLHLDNTNIDRLPNSLATIRTLKTITAIKCNFKEFPKNIALFVHVSHLRLENNQLESIHPSISKLSMLRALNLNDNLIQRIPEEMGALSETLEYLRLKQNPITEEERDRIRRLLPNTEISY